MLEITNFPSFSIIKLTIVGQIGEVLALPKRKIVVVLRKII